MLSIPDLAAWFADPVHWDGRYGLWFLLLEHIGITLAALLLAAIVALPVGLAIGHTGRGEFLVISLGSISRAVPTMGLLFALVLLWGVQLRDVSLLVALAAIAIPPLLGGAYAGVTSIPWGIRDSAKAQGMRGLQRVRFVEFPLATSSIIGGLRIAFIQVVSTVVLAPLVGLGGLGFGIIQGLALRNYSQVVASSLVIIVITILGSELLGFLQRSTADRLSAPHP